MNLRALVSLSWHYTSGLNWYIVFLSYNFNICAQVNRPSEYNNACFGQSFYVLVMVVIMNVAKNHFLFFFVMGHFILFLRKICFCSFLSLVYCHCNGSYWWTGREYRKDPVIILIVLIWVGLPPRALVLPVFLSLLSLLIINNYEVCLMCLLETLSYVDLLVLGLLNLVRKTGTWAEFLFSWDWGSD